MIGVEILAELVVVYRLDPKRSMIAAKISVNRRRPLPVHTNTGCIGGESPLPAYRVDPTKQFGCYRKS